ncbi:uncharacterized protein LOC134833544 [Culicoides brevitarsis]|uniref:uncharacterized protein LOC134833544 n=1 Tax=Culicoides brevitarsis TaxID=469753 RepID=UPI00307BDD69
MPFGRKSLEVITLPGAILAYKYSQFRQRRREQASRKVTERELTALHHKIEKLLSKLDESELEPPTSQEDECVICINARATMQTSPCGHRVVCRRCFVKTIQSAVAQRMLPLRCVICRTRINRLTSSTGTWRLQNSASAYSMRVPGSSSSYSVDGRVTQSASLFSMSSGSSCTSGMSNATSCSATSATSGTSGVSSTSSASSISGPPNPNPHPHKHSGSCSTGCLGAIPRNPSYYHQYQTSSSGYIRKHGQYSFRHRTLEMPNKLSPIKELPLRSNNTTTHNSRDSSRDNRSNSNINLASSNNNTTTSSNTKKGSQSSRRRTPSPVNNPAARFKNYTDPPATTTKNTDSDAKAATAKPSKIIINRENSSNHIEHAKSGKNSGPNKLGLNSKVVPVASKSPINKTNMATGKPITPVKAATTSRVVKSAGSGTPSNKTATTSGMTRSSSASCERNDNKRNENIEKKKKEEKLRLKLEKEAKKEEQRIAKQEAKEAKERTNRKKSFFSRNKEPKEVTEALLSAEVT